ncbi:MAG: hypothetical protein ACXVJW_12955, partial [Acidimicrobiia bacterium]
MTATAAVRHQRVARWPARPTVVAGTVVVVGCGLLAARPAIVELSPIPVITLVALFSALLVLGARLRLPTTTERPAWTTVP